MGKGNRTLGHVLTKVGRSLGFQAMTFGAFGDILYKQIWVAELLDLGGSSSCSSLQQAYIRLRPPRALERLPVAERKPYHSNDRNNWRTRIGGQSPAPAIR